MLLYNAELKTVFALKTISENNSCSKVKSCELSWHCLCLCSEITRGISNVSVPQFNTERMDTKHSCTDRDKERENERETGMGFVCVLSINVAFT